MDMAGFDEFKTLMIEEVRRLLAGSTEHDRTVVRESIAEMLGHELPSRTPPRRRQGHDGLAEELFLRFAEILGSVESLQNIEVYIRRAPDGRLGVSKAAYLRYHVENYLAELYILRERLLAYGTFISRRYRRDHRKAEIAGTVSRNRKAVTDAFRGVTHARGRHIHASRYDDPELSKLSFFDVLRTGDEDMVWLFEATYSEVRASKRHWVQTTNRTVKQLLDVCFGGLKPLLFTQTGALRSPSGQPPD